MKDRPGKMSAQREAQLWGQGSSLWLTAGRDESEFSKTEVTNVRGLGKLDWEVRCQPCIYASGPKLGVCKCVRGNSWGQIYVKKNAGSGIFSSPFSFSSSSLFFSSSLLSHEMNKFSQLSNTTLS